MSIKNTIYSGLISALFVFALQNNNAIAETTQSAFTPEVKIGGQVRYRGELDLRFFDMNAKPLFINMLRTRLDADAKITANIRAFVQLQDSRNFGEGKSNAWRGTLDGSSDNIDLHQGFIEFNNLGIDNLTIKLGRMMFNTNNERLIGSLEWHNFGRTYDGGWASYKFLDGWQARAFGFVLASEELLMTSAAPQAAKMLAGFELDLPSIPGANVYLYHDKNDKAIPAIAPAIVSSLPKLSRYTLGLYTKSERPGFVWEFESAFQFGTIDTLPRLSNNNSSDISAWMVSAYGGFKEGDFTIGGGIDAYSGDNPETDSFEGFDHLFFTIHKFYGGMDLVPYTVLPVGGIRPGIAGTTQGLMMPNIKAAWSPDSRLKLDAQFMMFRTFEPVKSSGNDLYTLGSEIDLIATYSLAKGVSAQFGSSVFLPGEVLEATNPARGLGTDPAFWGYTMLIVNF